MSPLLENASASVELGLEDFQSDDDRRLVSAVRNLYAGVLLLSKEVLRRHSPRGSNDILIRDQRKPVRGEDGKIRFVGGGKKTIGREKIERTFKDLQIAVDLSPLRRLADIRNDVEHMHPKDAQELIREAIVDAMPIIRDLIIVGLEQEPAEVLGSNAWAFLLDQAKVFREEQEACLSSFKDIDWGFKTLADALKRFRCPNCSAALLRNAYDFAQRPVDLQLICSKCGTEADTGSVVEEAVDGLLGSESHFSIKDGGESLVESCPECGLETYVFSEGGCVNPLCEFSLDGRKCSVCGEPLGLEDYEYGSGTLCGYHTYVISKAD